MDSTDSPEAPDPAVIELDRLSAAAREQPDDIDRQIALWTAVAGLSEWFFVNRGTSDAPRPYGIAAEAGTTLCVYSSIARAQAGAVAAGLATDDEPAPLFSVPLPAGLDWVLSLAENGVTAVVIDYPQVGAWSPLSNLARFRRL